MIPIEEFAAKFTAQYPVGSLRRRLADELARQLVEQFPGATVGAADHAVIEQPRATAALKEMQGRYGCLPPRVEL